MPLREKLPLQPGDWSSLNEYLAIISSGAVVNASDPRYGAKGDGVTDDSAAILAAVAALPASGGIVDLDPGIYQLLATNITLDKANVWLRGKGRGSVTIRRGSTLVGNVIGVTADNVTITDITIDGGLSGFPTNANHGISAQNVNHFLAQRVVVQNYNNSAILCQGTPAQTYRNNVIDSCRAEGGGVSNNGFLIGNLDESGIRHCVARNIPGSPGYGIQLKNNCRYSFIDDCVAISCVGGITFGRDSSPGVTSSRMANVTAISCSGGVVMGDATDNVIDGVVVYQTTNVSDGIRLQQASVGNVIKGVVLKSSGATSRSGVRFDDTSTDNIVELDLVDADYAAAAAFTVSSDRNLVIVKKYGTTTPGHEISSSSTGVKNVLRRLEDRQTLMAAALGKLTESQDRSVQSATSQPTTQVTYYVPVYLYAGEVVSNVTIHVGSFTGAPTNFFCGIYNAAGVQKAASADAAASISSTGQKTIAMATPYVVLDGGLHFIAILANAGTFQLLRQAATTAGKIGSGAFPYGQDSVTGTSLPGSAAVVAGTIGFWAAVS